MKKQSLTPDQIDLAKRCLDRSLDPGTLYTVTRHVTRGGSAILTPLSLYLDEHEAPTRVGYDNAHVNTRKHLGRFTFGRAYCEAAGYRWSSEYLGWIIPPGGMDPKHAIARELTYLLNIADADRLQAQEI